MDALRGMKFMRRKDGEKRIVDDITKLHASRQAAAAVPIPEGYQPLKPMNTEDAKRSRDNEGADAAGKSASQNGTAQLNEQREPCLEIPLPKSGQTNALPGQKVRITFNRSANIHLHREGRKKFVLPEVGKNADEEAY